MSDPIRDRIAAIILHERFRDGRVVRDDFNVDLVVAQILREFAVLHRSEETIFTEECFLHCGDGSTHVAVESTQDPRTVRNRAANLLAIADYIEAHSDREETPVVTTQQHKVTIARSVFIEAVDELRASMLRSDLPNTASKLADVNASFDGYKHEVIEQQKSAAEREREKVAERRNEVLAALPDGRSYRDWEHFRRMTRPGAAAIDRIIDLEDQLGARS